jgi:hypothetical protein
MFNISLWPHKKAGLRPAFGWAAAMRPHKTAMRPKVFFKENSLPPHKFYAAVFHPTGLKIFKIFQPTEKRRGDKYK